MKYLEIKKKNIYKMGSESIIYECDNCLFKKILDKKVIQNKLNKLSLLDEIDEIKKYYNKILGFNKEGYYIEKLDGIQLSRYNGNNKIDILKELKEILEILKTYHIYYLDINLGNIFINYEGVKLIDIDNIKINNYNVDLLPDLYYQYYSLGGDDINKAMTFVFNIMSVLFLENKSNLYSIKQIKNYEHLNYNIINDLASLNIDSNCDNVYLIDKLR